MKSFPAGRKVGDTCGSEIWKMLLDETKVKVELLVLDAKPAPHLRPQNLVSVWGLLCSRV